jgi:hypothetical protein
MIYIIAPDSNTYKANMNVLKNLVQQLWTLKSLAPNEEPCVNAEREQPCEKSTETILDTQNDTDINT